MEEINWIPIFKIGENCKVLFFKETFNSTIKLYGIWKYI
jgi:hypothetical protein